MGHQIISVLGLLFLPVGAQFMPMAENADIQKMAEYVSAEIFQVFGWQRLRLLNHDWECVEKEKHRKQRAKTHPSDVVFRYVDPYSGIDTYVLSDLKSYAKSTLDNKDFLRTLRDLANATECANKSPSFKTDYVDQTNSHEVIGLLFVYNHDGGYELDFEDELSAMPTSSIEVDKGNFVGVISPKRVIYLNSVAKEIKSLQADGLLPAKENRWFLYPHLARSGSAHRESKSCSLPSMLSPIFTLGYEFPEEVKAPDGEAADMWHRRGHFVFYDGEGKSVDEFKYLLDYLFAYQLDSRSNHIYLNLFFGVNNSASIFERARSEFARDYWPISERRQEDFAQILNSITFRTIQSNVPRFNRTELGMVRTLKL